MAGRLIDCFDPLKITPEKRPESRSRWVRFPGYPTIVAGVAVVPEEPGLAASGDPRERETVTPET